MAKVGFHPTLPAKQKQSGMGRQYHSSILYHKWALSFDHW
jgi:hypothetical protein